MPKPYSQLRAQMSKAAQARAAAKAAAMEVAMPDPFTALVRLSHAWSQDPHRQPHLQVCPACREALLTDVGSDSTLIPGPHRMALDASQVLGFTFSDGPRDTCALHPFLHGEDAHG
jgi:hypothetical protein